MDYLKIDDLVVGRVYVCEARNFTEGMWNGKEFEYKRTKFGQTFTDTELHWDEGAPHGTVQPFAEVRYANGTS